MENDGISYLIVDVEKDGKIEKREIGIDEEQLMMDGESIDSAIVTELKNLLKKGCKIVNFETLRYWEY